MPYFEYEINNDPDTMQLLHDLLALKGFETKSIYDSKEMPGILQSFEPSLVLVDINQKAVIDQVNDRGAYPTEPARKSVCSFYKRRPSPKQQGLGLGLYISKEIARAHHGTLTFTW